MFIHLIIYLVVILTTNIDSEKHKGFTWVGQHRISSEDFLPLTETNANWISLIPFAYMRNHNSSKVNMANNVTYYWGESDKGIITSAQYAKDHGLKIMLKPQIWLINMSEGQWRGTIRMDTEKEWNEWFASYELFIIHYAKMAEEYSYEAFCIGTELHLAAKYHPDKWRALIKKIRSVYNGELTYAANWSQEFRDVSFWDELDFIGIQAYFPLSQKTTPSVEELVLGWESHKQQIRNVSKQYKKDVIFTEIGYKSSVDAAIEPWIWPSQADRSLSKISLQTQSNCYEAFFKVFWHEKWFLGVHFWEWYPKNNDAGGPSDFGFTPQNKPAIETLKRWW
ncbi:MAG: hypothetical protein HKN92_03855 [Chitinophagales bacterium]|nr:hypothetical protein [Chitinophagales bacterium]